MTRKMKDSGVEWIGYMNTCWKTMPLKFILKERRQKNSPIITKERLSLSIGVGVTLYSEKTTNLDRFKDDVTQYKVAYPNDLVINSMNVIVGAEGISNYLGCVSPAYYVMYSSNPQKFITKYYDYCFKTSTIQKALFYLGKGIMAIDRGEGRVNTCRLKVSSYDLGRLEFPVPSVNEQHRIVEFLDNRCNKIDQTIQKEKQVIEKLKEYKQSVITEAVTKGLNPNVKLKDSGVEWIGEIPEDWQCVKLKLKVNTTKGYAFKADIFQEKGIPLVKASDIKNRTVVKSNVFIKSEFKELYSNVELSTNDILISTVGSTPEVINSAVGQIALVPKELNKSLLNQNVVKIVPNDDVYYLYLFYFLSTHSFRKYLDLIAHGTANQASLTLKDMLEYMITLPTISKQKEIADYLDKKCSSIDKLISDKEKVIKKLTEYKKSLIYECVTGKKEVQ
ncbi:restriction endonuclease subunit S [Clostridium sporogenes]|uniref:restriction endonuclease subunit S n=1 Tax=Clostridium sporogenes TaxID=1509 RepID=UPI0013D13FB0|nr:restriction endonuclease subunit S [Clostridium sporogenes]